MPVSTGFLREYAKSKATDDAPEPSGAPEPPVEPQSQRDKAKAHGDPLHVHSPYGSYGTDQPMDVFGPQINAYNTVENEIDAAEIIHTSYVSQPQDQAPITDGPPTGSSHLIPQVTVASERARRVNKNTAPPDLSPHQLHLSKQRLSISDVGGHYYITHPDGSREYVNREYAEWFVEARKEINDIYVRGGVTKRRQAILMDILKDYPHFPPVFVDHLLAKAEDTDINALVGLIQDFGKFGDTAMLRKMRIYQQETVWPKHLADIDKKIQAANDGIDAARTTSLDNRGQAEKTAKRNELLAQVEAGEITQGQMSELMSEYLKDLSAASTTPMTPEQNNAVAALNDQQLALKDYKWQYLQVFPTIAARVPPGTSLFAAQEEWRKTHPGPSFSKNQWGGGDGPAVDLLAVAGARLRASGNYNPSAEEVGQVAFQIAIKELALSQEGTMEAIMMVLYENMTPPATGERGSQRPAEGAPMPRVPEPTELPSVSDDQAARIMEDFDTSEEALAYLGRHGLTARINAAENRGPRQVNA